jgi:CBS domain-containing protein
MRLHDIHHLIVLEQRRVVGVVSARDLGGRVGARGHDGDARTVADVMSPHIVSATPETTVRQAANLMRGRIVGCLAVIDGDEPIGIVTTTDLLELIGRGAERPSERSAAPRTIRSRGHRRAGPTARSARRG